MSIINHTKREDIETEELYSYRARYDDAETQRFISLDTIGFVSGDFNFYRYAGNSLINYKDSKGLDAAGWWADVHEDPSYSNNEKSNPIMPTPPRESSEYNIHLDEWHQSGAYIVSEDKTVHGVTGDLGFGTPTVSVSAIHGQVHNVQIYRNGEWRNIEVEEYPNE